MTSSLSSDDNRSLRRSARRRLWMEAAGITFFWGTLAILQIEQRIVDPLTRGALAEAMTSGEVLYTFLEYGLWLLATPAVFWLASRFSLEGRRWLRHALLHVAIGIVASVAIDLGTHVFWNALTDGRVRPVSLGFVLNDFHFFPELMLYLMVLATGFARAYFLRYRERVNEAARLRAEAAELQAESAELQAQLSEAHLQALRMQLNPHFLFNTLNTISAYVEQDPSGVRRMIARLSELLRYTLDKSDAREVPLQQELDFIDGYLEIQRMRLDDRIKVERRIDDSVREALVPSLILQPLVENAVKHGISQLESGGLIELRAWREGDFLHVSVRDTGPGLRAPAGDGATTESHGIGLRNTRARLATLYGTAQQFSLETAEGGGLIAHLVLPYHTENDLYTTAVASERSATDPHRSRAKNDE